MKKVSEEIIKTLACKVITKPESHPFHVVVEDDFDSNFVTEYIMKRYAKNMIPIINACDTEKLKNEIRSNIDNARFEEIKIIEIKKTVYELQE